MAWRYRRRVYPARPASPPAARATSAATQRVPCTVHIGDRHDGSDARPSESKPEILRTPPAGEDQGDVRLPRGHQHAVEEEREYSSIWCCSTAEVRLVRRQAACRPRSTPEPDRARTACSGSPPGRATVRRQGTAGALVRYRNRPLIGELGRGCRRTACSQSPPITGRLAEQRRQSPPAAATASRRLRPSGARRRKPATRRPLHWPGLGSKAQLLQGPRGSRRWCGVFDKLDGFRDARRLILPALETPACVFCSRKRSRSPGFFRRCAHRRQRATARTARAPRRRECRGNRQPCAFRSSPTCRRRRKIFAALGEAVPGRSCSAPGALRSTAAGYRAPRRPRFAGDQSAGADQRRQLIACDANIVRDAAADSRHDPRVRFSRTLAERAMTNLSAKPRRSAFSSSRPTAMWSCHLRRRPGMMMMVSIGDHGMRAAVSSTICAERPTRP